MLVIYVNISCRENVTLALFQSQNMHFNSPAWFLQPFPVFRREVPVSFPLAAAVEVFFHSCDLLRTNLTW